MRVPFSLAGMRTPNVGLMQVTPLPMRIFRPDSSSGTVLIMSMMIERA